MIRNNFKAGMTVWSSRLLLFLKSIVSVRNAAAIPK